MRAPSADLSFTAAAEFDPLPAVAFIEQEAGVLRDALARPLDAGAILIALHAQERAHASWIGLVGAAEREGREDLAEKVATLYAFHGRLTGCLERSFDRRLDPRVEERLRALLISQLQRLTGRAVDELVACSGNTRS